MHKNLFWQAFLVVVFSVALWHTGIALYSYYHYAHLKAKIAVTSIDWQIEEKSDENYFLKAFYQYDFRGKSFSGNTVFSEDAYRNHWAAEQAIKEFSSENWKVWFDPQDPAYSSLQKKFPFKEWVSAAILWALTLYFLWLGYYITRFKN